MSCESEVYKSYVSLITAIKNRKLKHTSCNADTCTWIKQEVAASNRLEEVVMIWAGSDVYVAQTAYIII